MPSNQLIGALAITLVVAAAGCEERPTSVYFRTPPSQVADAASPAGPDAAPDLPALPPDGPSQPVNCTTPAPEVCDGRDNDCNGQVDDVPRLDLQSDVRQCGSCEITCLPVPANAEVACRAGQCVYACKEGYQDVNKSKVDGCECQFTGREVCDGKDNDCDGEVDEGFDLVNDPDNCGACGRKCNVPGAMPACVNRMCGIKACLPGTADRNGNPEDGCESNCADTNNGVEICDGKDNDCDGKVDELLSEANRTSDDKLVYLPPPIDLTIFAVEAARVDATDAKAGTNSKDRPCAVPGRLPWANVTKEEARDACKALGGNWRLCTRDEWLGACNKRGTQPYPYGAKYEPAFCNGADFRPNSPGTIPTGTAPMCAADGVLDLSGNVREWVLTSAAGDAFELRGGAYNVVSFEGDAPGLKCTGVVPAPSTAVRLPSVGFRCCHPGKLPAQ